MDYRAAALWSIYSDHIAIKHGWRKSVRRKKKTLRRLMKLTAKHAMTADMFGPKFHCYADMETYLYNQLGRSANALDLDRRGAAADSRGTRVSHPEHKVPAE